VPEDFPDPGSVEAARSRTEVILNLVRRDKPTLRQLLADLRRLRRFERGKLLRSFGLTLEGLHYTGAGGAI
jgi:hypothetical protein